MLPPTLRLGIGRPRARLVGCVVVALVMAGGSSDANLDAAAAPAADLSEELTGGDGVFIGSADAGMLAEGYAEHEYVAAGSASSYDAAGELTSDGRWTFQPGTDATYRTRVLVRQPDDPAEFSGVVIVEWLNVSGGVDADPEFATLHEEIVRQGHVWVGVSAQIIGVEGGPVAVPVSVPGADAVAGTGLKTIDPDRYGSLQHPGDAFSYDIFTQVARAIREGGLELGDAEPARVIAAGESQSAFALVTYINGVQPVTRAFDGFFVHSRGAVGLSLVAPGQPADIAGSFGGIPTILRTDADVPVFELQTESDVAGILNSLASRQPDADAFRLWEVAGTAHADAHLLGSGADAIDCGGPVNDGPMHVVAKAALRHLITWVVAGDAPPQASPLDVTEGDAPQIRRDGDGIALGGVRTPPVDVPVRVLSSEPGRTDSVICLLLGSTNPLPADRLAQLYPSRVEYESRYAAATEAAIDAGFVLDEDRVALDEFAHAELVGG